MTNRPETLTVSLGDPEAKIVKELKEMSINLSSHVRRLLRQDWQRGRWEGRPCNSRK